MSTKTPITKVLYRHTQKTLWACLFVVFAIGVIVPMAWKPSVATAAANTSMNFQARLLQASGALVSDGYYNAQFKLYYASGGALWTETYFDSNGVTAGNDNRVRVANGYLTVNLGALTPFPGTIDWDEELYLTMNIGGTTQTATPTWDGEMNPKLKITSVPYAFKAAMAANVASASTNAASTNSNAVSILSGNATGATSNSGNIVIDAGTATGTAGVLQLGTTNASAITLGRAGITSTLQGTISLNGAGNALSVANNATVGGTLGVTSLATLTGGATIGANTLFTNNGATLNGNYAIGNLDYSGSGNTGTIGTAAATVNIYTNFTIAQTTAGQTLTIPAPTSTTTGRLIYITNVGSAGYTIGGSVASPGTTMAFVWNSTTSAWTLVSSGTTGAYIQNGTSLQTANFNIQSNSTTSVTATIQGANSQSANILEVKAAGVGTPVFSVGVSSISLGVDTVLASGKSLTITGSGTRPASPTLGMLYFETTTNQLIQYNGSKWVSDRSTTTKIVAASNSTQSAKDSADYIVSGNADDEINAALTAAAGGTVYLAEGTYVAGATILIPNNTTLAGAGEASVIEMADLDISDNLIENQDTVNGTGIVIRDLKLDGRRDLNTAGTQHGIFMTNLGTGSGDSAIIGGTFTHLWAGRFMNGSALRMNTVANTKISNNYVFDDASNTGIYLSASYNNQVTGNNVQGNGVNGITLTNTSTNNNVENNVIRANDTYGVSVASSSANNTIVGNTINANGARGISIVNSDSNIVSNNNIIANGTSTANEGVFVSDSDYTLVSSNNISDTGCTTSCYAIDIADSTSDKTYLSDNVMTSTNVQYPATINDAGTGTVYASQQTPTQVLQSSSASFRSNSASVITGSIDPTASTSVVGVGTYFLTQLRVGDKITVTGQTRTVMTITDDTHLTVDTAFSDNANDTSVDRLQAALAVTNASTSGNIAVFSENNTPVLTIGDTGTFLFKGVGNNVNAFRIQRSGGDNIFAIDTSANRIKVGNDSAATGADTTLFVVDSATTANQPTGVNGGIFYDTTLSKLRCYENSAWTDCVNGNSTSFIQNQGTTPGSPQTANFNITGTGIAATLQASTSMLTPVLDTATGVAMTIGTATQTGLTVGRVGASTTINGNTSSSISMGNFTVSSAGAIVGVGVNSGTGLLQGTGGLTVSGADVSLNNNSNFNTSINTGTSTGAVTIGNGTSTAGTISLQGGAASSFSATNATGTTKLAFAAPSTAGTVTFRLPAGGTGGNTYDICTTLVVCTGYAPSATNGYVQFAPASAQADATSNSSIFINKTSGTGNLLQLQKSGSDKLVVTNAGNVGISATGANLLGVNNLTTADAAAQVAISTGANGNKGLVIQGVAGQDSSDYALQVQTSAGFSRFSVDFYGNVRANSAFTINNSSLTDGRVTKQTLVGTSGVATNDAVILANDGGNTRAITTTTARDIRVYGVAANSGASGATTDVVISGNYQVTANTGAVAIGDQLVTSTVAGQVQADNNATSGIIGIATTAKGAGASGLVGIAVGAVRGQANPDFGAGSLTTTGSLSAVGVNSGAGLLQGTGGLTVSGAAVSLNNNSNFNTSINTGTSTGTVTIGNSAAGAIALQSGTSIGITGVTNINASANNATNINTGTSTGAVTIGNSAAGAISLQSGSTIGITSTGNFSVDSNGTISVGTANATSVSIGRSGQTTTVGGGLTVGSGAGVGLLTNNGATINTTLALGDLAAGAIGTAAATVDAYTSISIAPTASGRTYTIPSPTTATAGRILYVSNVNATNSFTIAGTLFNPNATATMFWNGVAWAFAGMDGGSNNYIQNQSAADQAASFRVAGSGQITQSANASALSVTANAITTANALSVSSTGTGLTTGSLLNVSTATTGAIATNGAVSFQATGNYTSTANVGLLSVQANSTAAGTIQNIQGNALTTGQALYVSSTGVGLTSGSLGYFTTATTGAVATNGVVSLNATGNYTSTANAGLLDVKANATTAGTVANFNSNALTTGVGVNIGSTSVGLTSGSLLRVSSATTGAVATNGIVSLNASGNYTSTSNAGLLNVAANATTAGTVVNIQGTALTTGTALNINAGSGIALNAAGTVTVVGATNLNTSGTATTTIGNATGALVVNGATTFNSNVVVSANQSLTLTGGAGLPGSPTEGMMYYDTVTKKLLVYSNAKWQADRTEAVLVAASNSSQADKNAADYVGDGNTGAANDGDQVQINNALTAGSGKKVVLLAGTYETDGAILVPNNTTLTGVGNGTIIIQGEATAFNTIENSDTTTGVGINIRDMLLDGDKSISYSGIHRGIFLDGATAISIEHVVVQNFVEVGIYLNNTTNSTIADSSSTINDAQGIYLNSSADNYITNNLIDQNGSQGMYFNSSANNTISGNTVTNSNSQGMYNNSSANNIISGNTIKNSNGHGLASVSSSNVQLSDNLFDSNSSSAIYFLTNTDSTVSGNIVKGSIYGINLTSSSNNNTISGNIISDNTTAGILIATNNNIVTSNTFVNNGNTTQNNAIRLSSADNNTITSNTVSDNSCTTACYAINITDSASDNTYLADNRFSSTPGTSTINDAGTGTIYANQSRAENGGQLLNRTLNNASAFSIQGTNKVNIFNIDSTNGEVEVGSYNSGTNPVAGKLVVANANNANTITLQSVATPAANRTISLPDEDGTICLQNSANCGFALTAANGYVQFAPASAQADATNNSSIFINKTSGTGNLLQLQKSGSDKLVVTNAGNVGISATGANLLSVNNLTTADSLAQVAISTGANGNKGLVIQGVAGQTARLLEIQDSTGLAKAGFDSNGNLFVDSQAVTRNTATASTNSNGLILKSGNATGATSNSGDITIDSGTATGTTGTISVGATSASGITLGRSGITTTNAGALTVSQLLTGNLGATISGAAINMNASSNFATNINTGTSTGAVTIGGGTATSGTIALQGGAASSFSATNATGTTKLAFAAPSTAGTVTFQLPAGGTGATTYDICTTLVVCTGYAPSATNGYVQLAPAAAQTDSSTTNSSIFINKTNASGTPNILQFQKNGTDNLLLTNSGNLVVTDGTAASGWGLEVVGKTFGMTGTTTSNTPFVFSQTVNSADGSNQYNMQIQNAFSLNNASLPATLANMRGLMVAPSITNATGKTVTEAIGIEARNIQNNNANPATITNRIALKVRETANTGAITNNYGIYVEDLSATAGTTNDYPLYLASGTANQPLLSVGGTGATSFRNSANSTTAFQIQTAAGPSTVFNVNTTNRSVGINTNANTAYALDVRAVSGISGIYVQQGSATDELLKLRDSTDTRTMFNVNNNGWVNIQPRTDGAAFSIEDTTTADKFMVNTNWNTVGINYTLPNAADAALTVLNQNSAQAALTLTAHASQTGDILKVQNSGNTITYLGVSTSGISVTGDQTFTQGANRAISVATRSAAGVGYNLSVTAGQANGANAGGVLNLQGGSASATAGSNGGAVAITGANGTGTTTGGAGGAVTITGGNAAGSGNNAGGNITLQAGSATGTGTVGGVLVKNAANGTAAFQVQNTASVSLMTVDTANSMISLLGNNSGETAAWAATTALPEARDNTDAVSYNGYVYVVGGDTNGTALNTIRYAKVNNDGTLGSWTLNANNLPAARTHTTVAMGSNGYIYLLGGSTGLATNANNNVYYAKVNSDGSIGTFTTGSITLPANRNKGRAVVYNGYIYYVGGNTGAAFVNTVYYSKLNADGSINSWTTNANNLTVATGVMGVAVAEGYLYIVGGDTGAGTANVYYSKLNIDGSAGAFSSTTALPASVIAPSTYTANGYVYSAGGNISGTDDDEVYYAKLSASGGVTGGWQTSPAAKKLPAVRETMAYTQVGNYLYSIGGWNGSAGQTTAWYTNVPRVTIGGGLDLVGLTGTNYSEGRTGGALTAGNTNIVGTFSVQDSANFMRDVSMGGQLSVSGSVIFKNTTNSTVAFQVQNAAGDSALVVDTANRRVGVNGAPIDQGYQFGVAGASLFLGDLVVKDAGQALRFGVDTANSYAYDNGDFRFVGANRTIYSETQAAANTAGNNLTVLAATGNGTGIGGTLTLQGGTGGATAAGGVLALVGGTAGGGNTNGGSVTITGGTGAGTGLLGVVKISNPVYNTVTETTCAADCNLTQANISNNGAVVVSASATGLNITLVDPTVTTAGRVVYITAANASQDFTLRANVGGGVGLEQNIAMRQNTTATMIWNGTDWTAAGASSSTTLQAAYDNTLTAAGGAEIVLNNSASANGLTVRNNAATPIIGGIFEAQTSIGSNLLSVNNNAVEYATNGGAETAGGTSTTFPATTWDTTTGGTVSRYITAGDNVATGAASVSTVTTAQNHGARNRLSTTLTNGLTYTVSFAVRGSTNFSNLEVRYSPDGTTTGTTGCGSSPYTYTATSGQWKRISCSFVASGATSTNSILIRYIGASNFPTFYIDNLSVNVDASATYAADGSVDNAGSFGTNWTNFAASGTATMSRDTANIYDTSASAKVANSTATANNGMRNNMSITPQTNTQYLVSFYAYSSTTMTNSLAVGFLPAGGTAVPSGTAACTDYSTQSLVAATWTKITCLFTTTGTAISNADLVIYQTDAAIRDIYVDSLSITLNTNNANNVQIGGANKGGPTTLLTLDRAASSPIAANNDAYLGSMYYDTTTGRIQCYEADGWGACGSAPDNIVNLNPEYAGAVLNGTGVGTMTTDLCANGGGLTVNTGLCASGEAKNFYKWTSPQATQQTYSIYVSYQLPTTFKGFASDDTVQLTARADNTTNAAVTYEMFKSEGGTLTKCGTGETAVTTTNNTWQTDGINGNESTGCSFTSSSAGAFVIFKINLKANSNANAYVSTLSFTTTGN